MRGYWITYAAAGILMLFSLYYGSRLLGFSETVSVKYSGEGLSAGEIDRINDGSLEKNRERKERPFVTGWGMENSVIIENRDIGREMKAGLYRVYGDMSEAYPGALLEGGFVGKEDRNGCVVSREAAEELFGSSRAVGCEIVMGKGRYVVRGVMESEQAVMMIQTREGEFPYLELKYASADYAASNSKAALSRWGLLEYGCFVEGNLYAGAARLFMGFPFLVLFMLAASFGADRIRREPGRGRRLICSALAAAAFCLLFMILLRYSVVFSDDMIPARASDFAFWPEKFRQIRSDYRGLLNYQMYYREAEIVKSLRLAGITSAASVMLLAAPKLLSHFYAGFACQNGGTGQMK